MSMTENSKAINRTIEVKIFQKKIKLEAPPKNTEKNTYNIYQRIKRHIISIYKLFRIYKTPLEKWMKTRTSNSLRWSANGQKHRNMLNSTNNQSSENKMILPTILEKNVEDW